MAYLCLVFLEPGERHLKELHLLSLVKGLHQLCIPNENTRIYGGYKVISLLFRQI